MRQSDMFHFIFSISTGSPFLFLRVILTIWKLVFSYFIKALFKRTWQLAPVRSYHGLPPKKAPFSLLFCRFVGKERKNISSGSKSFESSLWIFWNRFFKNLYVKTGKRGRSGRNKNQYKSYFDNIVRPSLIFDFWYNRKCTQSIPGHNFSRLVRTQRTISRKCHNCVALMWHRCQTCVTSVTNLWVPSWFGLRFTYLRPWVDENSKCFSNVLVLFSVDLKS